MKIFLTGASGFIGSALARRLARVAALETRAALRRTDVELPPEIERVRIADIGPGTRWQGTLDGIEVVIHAAARAHQSEESEDETLEAARRVNCDGTLNLARQAVTAGVRRFVFLSSIKVNGEATPPGRPFRADDPPAPIEPYGIAKHEAEAGLRALAAESGLELVIIRPPLVYGPGVKGNFARLMTAVTRGWPLPLGAIDNRRSLVALDNLVDLVMTCVEHHEAAGKVWLVSDGEDLSTPELVRRLGSVLGRPARLLPVPPALLRVAGALLDRREAVARLTGSLQIDLSATRQGLGWQPPVSVDDGLRSLIRGSD